MIKPKIDILRNINKEDLKDSKKLEDIIFSFGLNGEMGGYLPSKYHKYYLEDGMKISQFPNQFANYLIYLSTLSINSYLEIGVRFGGCFIFTVEYLKRFNKNFLYSACVDVMDEYKNLVEYHNYLQFDYIYKYSTSEEFKQWIDNKKFDLILIDGDHSYEGCLSDYNLVNKKAKYLVLHDIVLCNGVTKVFNDHKKSYSNIKEFIDTYQGANNLGIGILS